MVQTEKNKDTRFDTIESRKVMENDEPKVEDEVLNELLNDFDNLVAMQTKTEGDKKKEPLTVEIDGQIYVDYDEEDSEEEEEEEDSEEDATDEERFKQSLAFLDDMIGMEHVKQKLLRLGRYALWRKKLKAEGYNTTNFPEPNLTFMFLGDPGTGKTTVAKQMGNILQSAGLITDDYVYEYRREDLVGQNYGCEEMNTKEALDESDGGVFFLDEAYQCFKQSTDQRDPGYHILETMMPHFDKPGRCIIMAGYKDEMLELFKVNPGFRSRIPDDNIIEFTGPSEQMLMDVADKAFRKMWLNVEQDASTVLRQHIHGMWEKKDKDFGNARVIRQLVESVVINHANRIMTSTSTDHFTISKADIQQSITQPQQKAPTRSRIGFV